MCAIHNRLIKFEARLQMLVEGSVARLFPELYSLHDLSSKLVEAMRAEIRTGANGDLLAPNLFTLSVHAQHASILQANKTLFEELAQILQDAGLENGLKFVHPLVIRLETAVDIASGEIFVSALHSHENLPETIGMEIARADAPTSMPQNAFLIVDGTQIFPLSEPVVNIGRRADNHLVIDDSRVSRVHAQLRVLKERYVIFDLDSLGGTWVNGARIQQHILQPGDVISLSGVPIVYGQDLPRPEETQEFLLNL